MNLPGTFYQSFMKLMDRIGTLEQLEILGLDARLLSDPEDIMDLSDNLPDSLVGIHLQTCWTNLPISAPEMLPLVCRCSKSQQGVSKPDSIPAQFGRLTEMKALTFLHLQDPYDQTILASESLAIDIPTLKLVGLGDEFWEVDRTDIKTLRPGMRKLTRREVLRHTVLDIDNDGWWW
jgi:hypothetical protein